MDLSGHDTSSTIEEDLEEDEDSSLEREIMQMFTQAKGNDKKHKDFKDRMSNKKPLEEFIVMYKKNRRKMNKSTKANRDVQTAYAKTKRQEHFNKRRHSSSESNKVRSAEVEDTTNSTKIFESVIEVGEFLQTGNGTSRKLRV